MAMGTETLESGESNTAAAEIARLRAEVDQLKARLAEIHSRSDVDIEIPPRHPWLQIAATVGITFALGKLIQKLRLPTAAGAAIPMITTEVNRRVF